MSKRKSFDDILARESKRSAFERERMQRMHEVPLNDRQLEHPVVVQYRQAEERIQQHNAKLRSQVSCVMDKMHEAERDVASITIQNIHRVKHIDEADISESALSLGPVLQSATTEERIRECTRLLLRGVPEVVEETKEVSRMEAFEDPLGVVEAVVGVINKTTCEMYSGMVDVVGAVGKPETEEALRNLRGVQHNLDHIRRALGSTFNFMKIIKEQCSTLRDKVEDLEAMLAAMTASRTMAVKIGRELAKENETLRFQLYQSAVPTRRQTEASIVLEGDVRGSDSHKVILMLQIENTHTARLSKPKLFSEAFLLFHSLLESVVGEVGGTRINYNSAAEGRELFDKKTNPRFASESIALELPSIGALGIFCERFQIGLVEKVKWPDALVEQDDFQKVMDPTDKAQVLWCGLRARGAAHVGTPLVSYPLAQSEDADNVPYFAGPSMERLAAVLQRSRGGEILLTGPATDAFEKARFKDPVLAPGVSLHERKLGTVPGVGPNEHITSMVPNRLAMRNRPEDRYTFRPQFQAVFPNPGFWRSTEPSDEMLASMITAEDDFQGKTKRLTPYQYEQKIATLEADAAEARTALQRMHDNYNIAIAEGRDWRTQLDNQLTEKEALRRRHNNTQKHVEALRHMLCVTEAAGLEASEALTASTPALATALAELDILRKERAARLDLEAKRVTVLIGPDEEMVWTDEEDDNADVAWDRGTRLKSVSMGRSGRIGGSRHSSVGKAKECQSCLEFGAQLDNTHFLLRTVAKGVEFAVASEIDEAELHGLVATGAQRLLGNDVPFSTLVKGAETAPAPTDLLPSMAGHVACIAKSIARFELVKAIRQKAGRRKSSAIGFGDELEHLSNENSSLQKKLADTEAARKADTAALREMIGTLNDELDAKMEESAKIQGRSVDLKKNNHALSTKLDETAKQSVHYQDEVVRLAEKLMAAEDVVAELTTFKKDFVRLQLEWDMKENAMKVRELLHASRRGDRHNAAMDSAAEEAAKRIEDLDAAAEDAIRRKEEEEAEAAQALEKEVDERVTVAAAKIRAKSIADVEAMRKVAITEAREKAEASLRREADTRDLFSKREELIKLEIRKAAEEEVEHRVADIAEALSQGSRTPALTPAHSTGTTPRTGRSVTMAPEGQLSTASSNKSMSRGSVGSGYLAEIPGAPVLPDVMRDVAVPLHDGPHDPISQMVEMSLSGSGPSMRKSSSGRVVGSSADGHLVPTDIGTPAAFASYEKRPEATQTEPLRFECHCCGQTALALPGALLAENPVLQPAGPRGVFGRSSGSGSPIMETAAVSSAAAGTTEPSPMVTEFLRRSSSAILSAGGLAVSPTSSSKPDLEAIMAMTSELGSSMDIDKAVQPPGSPTAGVSAPAGAKRRATGVGTLSGSLRRPSSSGVAAGQEDIRVKNAADGTRTTIVSRRVQTELKTSNKGTMTDPERRQSNEPRRSSPNLGSSKAWERPLSGYGGIKAAMRRESLLAKSADTNDGSVAPSSSEELTHALTENMGIGGSPQPMMARRGTPGSASGNRAGHYNPSHSRRTSAHPQSRLRPETADAMGVSDEGVTALQRRAYQRNSIASSIPSGRPGSSPSVLVTSGGLSNYGENDSRGTGSTSPQRASTANGGRVSAKETLHQTLHQYSEGTGDTSMHTSTLDLLKETPASLLALSSGSAASGVDVDDDEPYPSATHPTRLTDAHNKSVRQSATYATVRSPTPKLRVRSAKSIRSPSPTRDAVSGDRPEASQSLMTPMFSVEDVGTGSS